MIKDVRICSQKACEIENDIGKDKKRKKLSEFDKCNVKRELLF